MKRLKIMLQASVIQMVLTLFVASTAFANDESGIWADVAAGKSLIILRHALAPGTGDPTNFDINQCSTQRNLSNTGIEQATRIGAMFKSNGINQASVYTSQWCRCVDTANTMNIGSVQELPELNSFFAEPEKKPAQMQALAEWLAELEAEGPVILVTHQVVISALTGVYPTSGEAVVFKHKTDGSIEVMHRIVTD